MCDIMGDMLEVNNLSLQFGGRKLFDEVNIKFTEGNCYGIIGANGAGKSTFLRILSGELQSSSGSVVLGKGKRMSVLAQNQNAYDDVPVLRAVMMGHKRLSFIMDEKDRVYAKENFTDEDGNYAAELEAEFAELGGWEAESDAETLLNALKVDNSLLYTKMAELDAKTKVKVLLAQALFGNPDILILDEPTNNLDAKTVKWLEEYLLNFKNTIIIVSHNRYFLNRVCTHIADVDFGKINLYLGNYDFWFETQQILQKQLKDQNKRSEVRRKELQDFIARFSANASKSRQATSRKKELEKIQIEDIKPSSRRYPYVDFKFEREVGREILTVEGLSKKGFFKDVSFTVKRDEKIAFLADKSTRLNMLFDIIAGVQTPDSGTVTFGKTIIPAYMPADNGSFFDGVDLNLVQWLSQYSEKEKFEEFIRSFLGRMLFSGDEALKKAKVLSGGEKVRCMLSKMMLSGANFLIFDEPTNHLDLESITALNKAMVKFGGSILFATHDQEMMQTTANRIIEIGETKLFDKEIDYESYLAM